MLCSGPGSGSGVNFQPFAIPIPNLDPIKSVIVTPLVADVGKEMVNGLEVASMSLEVASNGLEVGKMTASPRTLMLRSSELGERLMTSPRSDEEEAAKQSDPLGTDPMVGREQEQ